MSEKTEALVEAIKGLVMALEKIRDSGDHRSRIVAKHALEKFDETAKSAD